VVQTRFRARAVAIDLDGTLLDTLPDIAQAADDMLADLGRPTAGEDIVRGYIGRGIPRLVKRLLTGDLDAEPDALLFQRALPLFEQHYGRTFAQRSRPFLGVMEGLTQLRAAGLRLACVTNKAQAFTLPLLAHTGIAGFFDLVVSGDTLARKKPDPAPLLHIAQRFDVAPGELLLIGDSDNDTEAARAAGCPVLCVPYGYSGGREVRDLDCDAIVASLIEAAGLIVPSQS
jgi:phosphoglycolate phosphatase